MKKWIILIIVLIAAVLRLYRLGDVPVGFHRDEAFLGYNAYSILRTGRDMTGNVLPLHIESFLYSPAGYSYAAIPAIFLFGLNPFAVRLPSAVAGILTVLAVYFLARALMPAKKPYRDTLSLTAAGLLAISPWNINLSRTATENSLVVFFLTAGLFVYIRYLTRKRFWMFILFLILFASTYVLYQAPRAFLPLIIPPLLLYGWQGIPKTDRLRVILLTAVAIYIPVICIMASPNLSVRIRTVSLLASEHTRLVVDESLREDGVSHVPPVIARLFHNKLIAYGQAALANYAHHFSYDFLLTDAGYPDRYRIPGSGIMYWWEVILVVTGMIVLISTNRQLGLLLLAWILLAPVGSSLTSDDVPNLQRTLLIYPGLVLLSAAGAAWYIHRARRILFRPVIIGLSVGAVLISVISYLHHYYVQQVYHRPWYRHEGYAQLVHDVNELLPDYSRAVITNHESSPTVFFLFYNKTDPRIVQELWGKNNKTDLNTMAFGNYEFSTESCPLRIDTTRKDGLSVLTGQPGVLYVNFAECKVNGPKVKELREIKRNDGSTVFRLMEVLP